MIYSPLYKELNNYLTGVYIPLSEASEMQKFTSQIDIWNSLICSNEILCP